MICRNLAHSAFLTAALAGLAAVPAQAAPAPALLPLATISVIDLSCSARADAGIAPSQTDSSISKSSAILSGATSALDRIRQQQAGLADAPALPVVTPDASRTPLARATVCPVASPATNLVVQPEVVQSPYAAAMTSDDFLATRRVAIGATPFDRQWQRVAHARLSDRQVAAAMGARPSDNAEAMANVNAWVNRQIRHVDDRVARGRADHWASAGQTLRRRSGDCEDFAILKYQMLAALGVAREDMFLTLARDLVRNADHAVLIVRHEGRFYMLDNATDVVLDASQSHDYRATMSFTDGRSFLHGQLQPA